MKNAKEILSKYSLTGIAIWRNITDKEVKILSETSLAVLDLSLIKLTDNQLKILSDYEWWKVQFWLNELTDNQAKILWWYSLIDELSLPNIEELSDAQLKTLLEFKWKELDLRDLKPTDTQKWLIKSSTLKIKNRVIADEKRKEEERIKELEWEKTKPTDEEFNALFTKDKKEIMNELWVESNPKKADAKNRILWLMIGWAIWDALWAPVEHQWFGSFPWVSNYQASSRLYEWEWTSDTAMALLLCESLLRKWETDLEDQMDNYLKRHINGYLWTRSYAKSEWNQTRTILEEYYEIKHWAKYVLPWEKDLSWTMQDWNGSLMRIWPVAAFFFNDIRLALKWADDSSKTTHNTKLCRDACTYFTGLIRWALHGEKKEKLLEPYYCPFNNYFKDTYFSPDFKSIIEGDYKHMREDKISDTRW